jgi:ABC-2 type transport system permease protein
VRTLLAFVRRDFKIQASYRFALTETVLGVIFAAGTYYFLGQLIARSDYLDVSGGNYFGFAMVGLVLTAFLDASIFQVATVFRTEQSLGTLDALLATPISLPVVLLGSALWPYALACVQAIGYAALAIVLGVDFHAANWPGVLLVVCLSINCFACLSVAEAGIGIVIKRGNPLAWLLSTFSALVGGAFFPTSLLPSWLQWISAVHPLSYATHAARAALFGGASFEQLLPDLSVLVAIDIAAIPASLLIFAWAIRTARTDGSMAHV